jgi:hypothetical protein
MRRPISCIRERLILEVFIFIPQKWQADWSSPADHVHNLLWKTLFHLVYVLGHPDAKLFSTTSCRDSISRASITIWGFSSLRKQLSNRSQATAPPAKPGNSREQTRPRSDTDQNRPSGLCASGKSLYHDEVSLQMAECTNGIAGHDGAGVVVAVGHNVQDMWQIGHRAGIK